MIQTQRLEYADHSEEISTLNVILHDIESGPRPLSPHLVRTVERILARLDHLMTADTATLKIYDQRESRV